MTPLALDHLTAVDATPSELVDEAHRAGCDGVCLFMESMDVLPLMPEFNLIRDRAARLELRRRMEDQGIALALAYPFTLAGRSEVADFVPALECAAQLDARLVNLLIYDRDPARRHDRFAAFCDLARSYSLRVAVEFYPASQIGTLAQALELVTAVGRSGEVGINVDLLHLMRSGGNLADVVAAPQGTILIGQMADGQSARPEAEWEFEASGDRLRGGEGDFDLAGFACALPAGCPISVEIPRNAEVLSGVPRAERVRLAVDGIRRIVAEA